MLPVVGGVGEFFSDFFGFSFVAVGVFESFPDFFGAGSLFFGPLISGSANLFFLSSAVSNSLKLDYIHISIIKQFLVKFIYPCYENSK